MKWIVGYQLTRTDAFVNEIIKRKAQVSDVYFSWGTMPNGRHASAWHGQLSEREAQTRMEEDLRALSAEGISFNLLLNGNCYGRRSLSRALLTSVCDSVDDIGARFGLASVTTTSPVLARVVKTNFPELEVRASVNIGVGTPSAMDDLAGDFDSYYLQRELNRDRKALNRLVKHGAARGKKCYLLANSGCLNYCAARCFHDNLVSHEREIAEMDNGAEFRGLCADYLRAGGGGEFLRRSNAIRPEDVGLYEGTVPAMKLATRVNKDPAGVLRAYAEGRYSGNLPELLEPDNSPSLYPFALENSLLPPDYGERTSSCGGGCERGSDCRYCAEAARRALVRLSDAACGDMCGGDCGSCGKNGTESEGNVC